MHTMAGSRRDRKPAHDTWTKQMCDDLDQERALAEVLSKKYGHEEPRTALHVVRRARRHRKKEFQYAAIYVPLPEQDHGREDIAFERILVHELMDLLPFTAREAIVVALSTQKHRKIKKAATIVRENLPREMFFDD